jgi:uncharacterized protein (DUF2062 family)
MDLDKAFDLSRYAPWRVYLAAFLIGAVLIGIPFGLLGYTIARDVHAIAVRCP